MVLSLHPLLRPRHVVIVIVITHNHNTSRKLDATSRRTAVEPSHHHQHHLHLHLHLFRPPSAVITINSYIPPKSATLKAHPHPTMMKRKKRTVSELRNVVVPAAPAAESVTVIGGKSAVECDDITTTTTTKTTEDCLADLAGVAGVAGVADGEACVCGLVASYSW